MVEIGIIRQVVNPNPADWLTAFPALPQRFEQRGILFDVSMTVHARRGGRDRGVGCIFHSVVAIATVDPKLTRMKCVGVWNGLLWHVAHICGLWAKSKSNHKDGVQRKSRAKEERSGKEKVAPLGEDVVVPAHRCLANSGDSDPPRCRTVRQETDQNPKSVNRIRMVQNPQTNNEV